MNAPRDPFLLLSDLPEVQPDPTIMSATIAQSVAKFSRRRTEANRPRNRPFFPRSGLLAWLVPVGCAAFGLIAGIALAPLMTPSVPLDRASEIVVADAPAAEILPEPTGSQGETTLSRGAPEVEPEAVTPEAGPMVRMGAQTGPRLGSPDAPPAMLTVFTGENIRVGAKFTASMLELFLPDLSGETVIDQQGMVPGEEIEILAAFRQADPDRVAIKLRVNEQSFWRVYELEDGAYMRNAELSRLVVDAETSEEVLELLGQD